MLKYLNVPVRGSIKLRLANGKIIERDYGPCEIYVAKCWVGTTIIFGGDKDLSLLGANTMDDAKC